MSARGQGPPARAVIRKMANRSWSWAGAIGELIDNSCGNGATNVTVRLTPTTCEVRDNGNGCTEKMFAAMQSFGWHQEDEEHENSMSLYGVGCKDAVIWAGGPTEFRSIRDTARAITVDWDSFGKEWIYPSPDEGDAAYDLCKKVNLFEHGTIVRMPCHRRQMNRAMVDGLIRGLNAQHWAAVDAGIIIRVEFLPRGARKVMGGPLPGKPLPSLKEGATIERNCELNDGRQFRIVGGILAPDERMSEPGFEYLFGHRVVVTAGSLGAGQMSFERIYCRVFLGGDKSSWQVTTNKDGIHDSDQRILGEAVFRECRDILVESQSEPITSLVEKEIEESLSEILTDQQRRRGKRRPPANATGPQVPTGRGGKHHNFTNSQPGDNDICSDRKSGGKIHVLFADFEDEKAHLHGIAKVRDRVVRLNRRHSKIANCLESNAPIEVWDLIASPLWAHAWVHTDDNGNAFAPGCERGRYEDKLAAMLGHAVDAEAKSDATSW